MKESVFNSKILCLLIGITLALVVPVVTASEDGSPLFKIVYYPEK